MNFDWSDYLSLSGDLLTRHASVTTYQSACWRTIVSRSYYAAFHMALTYCMRAEGKRWKIKPASDSHEQVRLWFLNRKNEDERTIASRLLDLKLRRKDADYTEGQLIDEEIAKWAHGQADEIIEALEKIAAPPKPPAPTPPAPG